VRRANADLAGSIDWHDAAVRLGADVAVCLAGHPALMWGIGDRIEPLPEGRPSLAGLAVVLVNPRMPLPTAKVFAALQAGPAPPSRRPDWHDGIASPEQLLEAMRARGNDLERPAIALLPVIADIKAALAEQAHCRHAALSGSGPTCFGVFSDDAVAAQAAAALAVAHPHWWIVATRLSGTATD
jgi:4-diphosphocytidyl-2-C-methyl-D-erythritol kinase